MLSGHLHSLGIILTQRRVIESLNRIDPYVDVPLDGVLLFREGGIMWEVLCHVGILMATTNL